MFNSSSPYTEGRKDGFSGAPANRGRYGAFEWAEYLSGYTDGTKARRMFDRAA